ncbi:unnamed protein product [Rhizophagus irregularis]|nr:unnamed protein product [Rhizophagus irregularis]
MSIQRTNISINIINKVSWSIVQKFVNLNFCLSILQNKHRKANIATLPFRIRNNFRRLPNRFSQPQDVILSDNDSIETMLQDFEDSNINGEEHNNDGQRSDLEQHEESDYLMSSESDYLMSSESDYLMSSESDYLMSSESDYLMSSESDYLMSLESDYLMSSESA